MQMPNSTSVVAVKNSCTTKPLCVQLKTAVAYWLASGIKVTGSNGNLQLLIFDHFQRTH